jgi:hypothetical protein
LKRNLMGITSARPDGTTHLSRSLSPDEQPFLCRGLKPWLGEGAAEACSVQLRGSLRGAGNVYFPVVKSALFLPRTSPRVSERLLALLDEPAYSSVIRVMGDETQPRHLRQKSPEPLAEFGDEEVSIAITEILDGREEATAPGRLEADPTTEEVNVRRAEYEVLKTRRADDDLVVRPMKPADYLAPVKDVCSHLSLVVKLRETRAFAGFARVFPNDSIRVADRTQMLWRHAPPPPQSWLPAHVVHGEGVLMSFREDRLSEWENRPAVRARLQPLLTQLRSLETSRRFVHRDVSPRLVMLHTVAHMLLSRLTFECGYSSASLRERLFVSDRPEAPMAGFLIYTAAGDSDGTMGGLVRMGQPGSLEPVLTRALEVARWCSSDPVCMESRAQGPLSLNLAACHSCALVPETACEEMNRFLDRALVVGTLANPSLGFLSSEG